MTHTTLQGPALDAEIAQKVMGDLKLIPPVDVGRGRLMHWKVRGEIMEHPPAYSSSIEAAWQVVERMWDLGHELDHLSHMPRLEGGDWTVKFAKLGAATCHGGYAHTPSAQLSICLAALAALQEEKTKP